MENSRKIAKKNRADAVDFNELAQAFLGHDLAAIESARSKYGGFTTAEAQEFLAFIKANYSGVFSTITHKLLSIT